MADICKQLFIVGIHSYTLYYACNIFTLIHARTHARAHAHTHSHTHTHTRTHTHAHTPHIHAHTHTRTHTHTHTHQVEELAPFGSLHSYILKEGSHATLQLFHTYSCQIADAMAYLETRRIVHRDLAIRNILLAHVDFVSHRHCRDSMH